MSSILGVDGRFVIGASLGGTDVFRPVSFPGLDVSMADLWGGPAATP